MAETKVEAGSIPASEWEALAQHTGTDLVSVGTAVIETAAFMLRHKGLSTRAASEYMSAHYSDAALSHTTIAQHVRLDASLSAFVALPQRSAELFGMARSILGTARYSWERWEAAIKWQTVALITEHDGERSAEAVRLIRETYAASQTAESREAATAERKRLSAESRAEAQRKRAEAEAEAKAAEAEAVQAATAELSAELSAVSAEAAELRGSIIRPGEPGSWGAFAELSAAFLPYAERMPLAVRSALSALLGAAEAAPAPAPSVPRKPRKPRATAGTVAERIGAEAAAALTAAA